MRSRFLPLAMIGVMSVGVTLLLERLSAVESLELWTLDIRQQISGVGGAPLFPSPADPAQPMTRHLADKWLREGERLAGVKPQKGSLWHAYRRKWATERKHLPDADVAATGGWKNTVSLKTAYQQADPETILRVVLEAGELREAR